LISGSAPVAARTAPAAGSPPALPAGPAPLAGLALHPAIVDAIEDIVLNLLLAGPLRLLTGTGDVYPLLPFLFAQLLWPAGTVGPFTLLPRLFGTPLLQLLLDPLLLLAPRLQLAFPLDALLLLPSLFELLLLLPSLFFSSLLPGTVSRLVALRPVALDGLGRPDIAVGDS